MTILHNHIEDDGSEYNDSNRTVLLHQHADKYDTSFTTASFTASNATIARMTGGKKPKHLHLGDVELDALVEAWTTFKADVAAAKAAKVAKQQEDLTAALSLAREMRDHLGELGTVEIKVNHDRDEPVYTLKLPALQWTYYSGYSTNLYNGTQLLQAMRKAFGQVANHILTLQKSSARPGWNGNQKEQFEGWITAWEASQEWVSQVKAAHFPIEAETKEEKNAPTTTYTVNVVMSQ